ncbi:MAG: 3-isopropylmalate dehydratase large subunit [Myxococcota bacterium]|mgnify:CR=1 FL=1
MGMTLTEKVLAAHAGRPSVRPGDLIFCNIDFTMGSDVTTPLSAEVLTRMGASKIWDPRKAAVVQDHFVPAKDIRSAELSKSTREFARTQEGLHYFEIGRAGICHVVIPDAGLVVPGDLVVGADSHTCTYGALGLFSTGVGSTDLAAAWALGETWFRVPPTIRVLFRGTPGPFIMGKDLVLKMLGEIGVEGALYQSLEFGGEAIAGLSMPDRLTITNMAIEAGAKNGIMEADETTLAWVRARSDRTPVVYRADPDAEYVRTVEIDVEGMEPQVAAPFRPDNVHPISELAGTKVDQLFCGSCTNGRIEDYRVIAGIMGKRKVHPDVRMLILPASHATTEQMAREGILQQLLEAGAEVGPSTCGPCIGGHMGVLGSGEVGLYTSNRNFVGRVGARDARVYLSSPAVAAATAITGVITDPREIGVELPPS